MKSEIIFEVTEAEEGGYCASALGCGITTQGETLEELRAMVRDAVVCYFDDPAQAPGIIRLFRARRSAGAMKTPRDLSGSELAPGWRASSPAQPSRKRLALPEGT